MTSSLWFWAAIYGAGTFATFFIILYSVGQHYGESHKTTERVASCDDPACKEPNLMATLMAIFWPVIWIMVGVLWLHNKILVGGANSKLPPLNSLTNDEAKKKKDIEWLA